MSKIRLAYLVSTLGRTGPTRQLHNLLQFLDRELFDPAVITLSPNPADNLEQSFLDLDIDIYTLGLMRFASAVFGKQRLLALLREIEPDILHSQGLRADWLSSRLDDKYQRLATQRNDPLVDYPALTGKWRGGVAAWLHSHALNRLPVVVACSQAIAESSITRGRPAHMIHNGVDYGRAKTLLHGREKRSRRAALDLPVDARLFVFAGPLIPRKDPEYLIQAIKKRAPYQDALLILGDGPLLSRCHRLAETATNIELRGSVETVGDYLQVADCLVSASRAEGLPNAVLEGLAIGLPALLSDIPAHREILALSPAAGWLFSVDAPNSLGRAIEALEITDHNRENARELASRHFSAEVMSRAYQHLYTQQVEAATSRI